MELAKAEARKGKFPGRATGAPGQIGPGGGRASGAHARRNGKFSRMQCHAMFLLVVGNASVSQIEREFVDVRDVNHVQKNLEAQATREFGEVSVDNRLQIEVVVREARRHAQ